MAFKQLNPLLIKKIFLLFNLSYTSLARYYSISACWDIN